MIRLLLFVCLGLLLGLCQCQANGLSVDKSDSPILSSKISHFFSNAHALHQDNFQPSTLSGDKKCFTLMHADTGMLLGMDFIEAPEPDNDQTILPSTNITLSRSFKFPLSAYVNVLFHWKAFWLYKPPQA